MGGNGDYLLYQNYPNPFNASTVIRYVLTGPTEVSLKIYNITGKEIITLAEGHQPAGTYQLIWDGKDSNGQPVPSGVYFYRLERESLVQTKAMSVVR